MDPVTLVSLVTDVGAVVARVIEPEALVTVIPVPGVRVARV